MWRLSQHHTSGVAICFEDEAGEGLSPPKGRTWAWRGARPVVQVRGAGGGRISIAGVMCYRPVPLTPPPAGTGRATLSVMGSNDGTSFTTIAAPAGVHLRPIHRQHGDHHLPSGECPVRADELQRQHRVARRGLRTSGPEHLSVDRVLTAE
jgi:hypothetical protein